MMNTLSFASMSCNKNVSRESTPEGLSVSMGRTRIRRSDHFRQVHSSVVLQNRQFAVVRSLRYRIFRRNVTRFSRWSYQKHDRSSVRDRSDISFFCFLVQCHTSVFVQVRREISSARIIAHDRKAYCFNKNGSSGSRGYGWTTITQRIRRG